MSNRVEFIRFPIALLSLAFVLKLIMGFAGLPYEESVKVIAMVPLTIYLCMAWGAVGRAFQGASLKDAALVGVSIALVAQILILGGTVLSNLIGVETYFNHPQAVARTDEILTFMEALGARLFGLVINCILGALAAVIGWALGNLVPSSRTV